MQTNNKTEYNRFFKFAGNKVFDDAEVKAGEVLVPKVMHKQDFMNKNVNRANLVTWRIKNGLGQMVNILVGFMPVRIEEFDAYLAEFNSEEKAYATSYGVASCGKISLDFLKECLDNPHSKVVDVPGSTHLEDEYNAKTRMNNFIAWVKLENPINGRVLEMRRDDPNPTQKHIAEVLFPDLGKTQGSHKVKQILAFECKHYHELYD